MANEELDLGNARQAHSVQVFFCANPRCLRPHVVLKDEHGKPFAHFVLPDRRPDGSSFLNDLQNAAYRSVAERG